MNNDCQYQYYYLRKINSTNIFKFQQTNSSKLKYFYFLFFFLPILMRG